MDERTCTFCSRAAALVPTEECRVCLACAHRVAHHAAHAEPNGIWDAPTIRRDEEMVALAERVSKELSAVDEDVHYHLALTYREMGLHADALHEAAVALSSTEDIAKATAALRVIVTAPILRSGGLTVLRARLTMH